MTIKRRLVALLLVAVLGSAVAACGDDNSTSPDNKTGSTLVENGEQRGSGSDGTMVGNDHPGNTPGAGNSGDEPTGNYSGQDKP